TRTMREKEPVAGISPTALALSNDNQYLFVAYSAINAVAVFDVTKFLAQKGLHSDGDIGLIPTDWYPSALAVHGDDLLIATAKGEGSRPNKDMGKTVYETKHKDHPYIPTLLKGSIARLNIPDTVNRLVDLTNIAERNN